jgi:hypothetical protein
MTRQDWMLLVLAAADGAALQPVQLQKVLFLLGKRMPHEVGTDFYTFEPYDYGPFDANVYRDAEALAMQGLATITHGRWKTYASTPAGSGRAARLAVERPHVFEFIRRLVAWARSLTFQQIVKAIYAEFPDMRAKSVFRD